ncbi:DUF2238 domain-containing protein [Stutzerimonas chloritidismutans]|uniref:DUF2238 domain-containing protein n=1 Tax=Stutzerimonas chloritidismutans TaxID=203192 RepID=A0ABU9MF24_STUCH
MHRPLLLKALVCLVVLALLASAIDPHDRTTWLLEVLPVAVLLPALVYNHQRFPLSSLLYLLLAVQALGLIAGGHYTFARVPVGFWLQDWLDLSRNHYDRIGHFFQGVVPALIARELLVRKDRVHGKHLLPFVCVSMAMMLSAVYELVEWAAALALGQGAEAFLGMQGDQWDTQADMFCALLGSLTAMTLLVHLHDRSMAAIGKPQPIHSSIQGQTAR